MVVYCGWVSPPPSFLGQHGPFPREETSKRLCPHMHSRGHVLRSVWYVVSWVSTFARRTLQRGGQTGRTQFLKMCFLVLWLRPRSARGCAFVGKTAVGACAWPSLASPWPIAPMSCCCMNLDGCRSSTFR